MRITLGMILDGVRHGVMNSADRLLEAQDRATTGKRISRPSDDVPGIGRALTYRSAIATIEQFKRNADIANSQMSMTCATLDSIVDELQGVWKAALQAGGPATNGPALDALAMQLEESMKSLGSLANTQHLGKYIFAGSDSTNPPFSIDPNAAPPCTYNGDSTAFVIQVAPGIYLPSTVTGDELFNVGGSSVAGTPDVFTTLQELRDLVKSGDVTNISAKIEDVKKNLDNIVSMRSQIGARMKQLDSNQSTLMDSKIKMQILLSETEDADMAEELIELMTRQNVYQAAIATASRVLQTSLTDFLK